MSAAAKVPHKHAEVIRAWADGATVQFQFYATKEWADDLAPQFHAERKYRVKPEKVYPVTQMTIADFNSALAGDRESLVSEGTAIRIANAALRHAIEANQIIAMDEHQATLLTLGQNLRGVEITRHAARDMAIAKAVCHWYGAFAPSESALINVIAKVHP
jgi:hypothetical protein